MHHADSLSTKMEDVSTSRTLIAFRPKWKTHRWGKILYARCERWHKVRAALRARVSRGEQKSWGLCRGLSFYRVVMKLSRLLVSPVGHCREIEKRN